MATKVKQYLEDNFKRRFTYLRLSVTEVCNFKCSYCLPSGYKKPEEKNEFLSLYEIKNLIRAFSRFGVKKVRITGGEPLVRNDLEEIIKVVRNIQGIDTVALSTNGYGLKNRIKSLYNAGLSAINVSIDSLNEKEFQNLTGRNILPEVLGAIDEAVNIGVPSVKINSVILKNNFDRNFESYLEYIKDRPVCVRFIELMETGGNKLLFEKEHYSAVNKYEELKKQGWRETPAGNSDGPARVLKHPGYTGTLGFIMPYTPDFCNSCNRLRITSKGKLRLCLFSKGGYDLRPLIQSRGQIRELQSFIIDKLQLKEVSHFLPMGIVGNNKSFSMMGG